MPLLKNIFLPLCQIGLCDIRGRTAKNFPKTPAKLVARSLLLVAGRQMYISVHQRASGANQW
jgi:hypothetical protein